MRDDRAFIARWWSEAWSEGLWAAAWSKSVEGVTGEQAAWRPPSREGVSESRHSICQHVWHIVFWRESWLRRVETGVKPSEEELARLNWRARGADADGDWADARRRLAQTQERIAEVLADEDLSEEHFRAVACFVPHDCYHFGQINMIRGMLGMRAIE